MLKHYVTAAIIFLLIGAFLTGCNKNKKAPPADDAALIHMLVTKLHNAIMQDAFTPPVAARIYAYSNITAYEASRLNNEHFKSLVHQLNGLDTLPPAPTDGSIDNRVVMIWSFAEVANSTLYRDSILENYRDSLIDLYTATLGERKIQASIDYAKQFSDAIIKWANKDGYLETRKMPIYTPLKTSVSWQPTPPKYADAIEPYWGMIRPFVLDSVTQFGIPFNRTFDTVPSSTFYKMVKELYDTTQILDDRRRMIAQFWDNNPLIVLSKGHTMINFRQITPGGHWVNITKIVSKEKKLNLQQACDAYMRVSVALQDAFIASWYIKYTVSSIRPITYINKYIDPEWKPLIETPPFPEYTCGHSTISAAASQALACYFGDSITFVDNTDEPYDLPVRTFKSFLEASEEAGRSRMYGGIHFHHSCTNGRMQGLDIGKLVGTKIITEVPAKSCT